MADQQQIVDEHIAKTFWQTFGQALARKALAALATFLVMHGVISGSESQAFIEGGIGLIVAFGSIALTWYDTAGRQMVKDALVITQARLAARAAEVQKLASVSTAAQGKIPPTVANQQQAGGR